jgi:hypothetical protein
MTKRIETVASAVAVLGLGAAFALWYTRRRYSMTREELTAYVTAQAPSTVANYASDVATAAMNTLPRDYYDPAAPDDGDAALRRWALLLAAVGDHESSFGAAPGYFPKGDPAGWGDRGNAFGFFQLDKHYFWTFIQSANAPSVTSQAIVAAGLLKSNFAAFADLPQDSRERLAVICYNAARKRIRAMIDSGSTVEEADATTTKTANGTPYGADVLARLDSWVPTNVA